MRLTDDQMEDLQYGDHYASWLISNGFNYGVMICNGHTLLDAQERGIGFDEYLSEIGAEYDDA